MNLVNSEFSIFQKLIFAYARRPDRNRYAFLFALDNRLADIIRTANETLIAQMKLTWWRDIINMLPDERPQGEPLVQLLNELGEKEMQEDALLRLIEGWEILLEDFPWDDRQFDNYSRNRGQGYFAFGLRKPEVLGVTEAKLAQGWALWDLARNCSDDKIQNMAFEKVMDIWPKQGSIRFDSSGRPLSIFCKLIEGDVRRRKLTVDLYRPSVAGKILWHGLTRL